MGWHGHLVSRKSEDSEGEGTQQMSVQGPGPSLERTGRRCLRCWAEPGPGCPAQFPEAAEGEEKPVSASVAPCARMGSQVLRKSWQTCRDPGEAAQPGPERVCSQDQPAPWGPASLPRQGMGWPGREGRSFPLHLAGLGAAGHGSPAQYLKACIFPRGRLCTCSAFCRPEGKGVSTVV